jgi:hypothetical protein
MNNYGAEPAPTLTKTGCCSNCDVHAIWSDDNELQVCPKCYALLWHIDYTTKQEQQKELAAAARREQNYTRRAAYEAAREAVHAARLQAREVKVHKP